MAALVQACVALACHDHDGSGGPSVAGSLLKKNDFNLIKSKINKSKMV